MKRFAWLGLLALMTTESQAATPASFADYSDIDVVSVLPRSPDVKPLVMVVLPKSLKQKIAAEVSAKSGVKRIRQGY